MDCPEGSKRHDDRRPVLGRGFRARRAGTLLDGVPRATRPSRRRAMGRKLPSLAREAAAIVSEAVSSVEAVPRCVEAMCAHLGWDLAIYWSFEPDSEYFHGRLIYQSARGAGGPSAALSRDVALGPHAGPLAEAWTTGEPTWIRDIGGRPAVTRLAEAAGQGMRAAFWLPVPCHKCSSGVLEFFSQDRRPLPADGLQSLTMIALLLGQLADAGRTESDLAHQDLHDRLTGLPNRTYFVQRLRDMLEPARAAGSSVALLLFDLNRFKEVNDTLGHRFGDQVLVEVSTRVQSLLSRSACLARLSGDEFGIMVPETAGEAVKLAHTVLAVLEMPYDLDGHSVAVGASLGMAFYPADGGNADDLLRHADVAIDLAKRMGGGYQTYDTTKDPHSLTRLTLATDLRQALENDGLNLCFQPMHSLPDGKFTRVEALARWQHPDRGHVAPESFIPVAETIGLMGVLTLWVLESALLQQQRWAEAGHDIGVSVNLSARTLQDTQLPETVAWLIHRYAVPAQRLTLEITESTLMADPVGALDVLNRLWNVGVRIAIDDFGTGYSSLSYLKGLPVHEIKIDKSFVMGTATSRKDVAIVRSVIELGHNLGLEVVAEGVETMQAWNMLVEMGCDVAQGNLVGLPMPAAALPLR
jgi:diguanylate cyclase (GGDEF)-like protein